MEAGVSNRFHAFEWTGKFDSKTLGVGANFFMKKESVFENIVLSLWTGSDSLVTKMHLSVCVVTAKRL